MIEEPGGSPHEIDQAGTRTGTESETGSGVNEPNWLKRKLTWG